MDSDMAQAAGGMTVGARTAKPVSESVEGRRAPAAALPMFLSAPMLLSASDFTRKNNSLPVAARVKRTSITGAERQAKSRRKKKEGHVTLKEAHERLSVDHEDLQLRCGKSENKKKASFWGR